MLFFQKFTKTILSLVIIVAGITFVDRELIIQDPVAKGLVKVAKAVDPRQLRCLAENIFHEAGSEDMLGQAAVARVVMNRVKHGFASTPCGVVHQKTTVVATDTGEQKTLCQFSWVCDDKTANPNSQKYLAAKNVAYQVLAYDAYDGVVPKSTLFFHNTSVNPQWPYHEVAKIGNHVFYSKNKPKNKTNEQSRKGS